VTESGDVKRDEEGTDLDAQIISRLSRKVRNASRIKNPGFEGGERRVGEHSRLGNRLIPHGSVKRKGKSADAGRKGGVWRSERKKWQGENVPVTLRWRAVFPYTSRPVFGRTPPSRPKEQGKKKSSAGVTWATDRGVTRCAR